MTEKAARAIYRYVVPVDDKWHEVELSGPLLHVGSRAVDEVEFWVLHGDDVPHERYFRVFGTGMPLPDDRLKYHGTVYAAGGALVWHLIERWPPTVVVLDGTN